MIVGELDERVADLVSALNDLMDVYTFSSCGGHAVITNPSQRPEGEFYVCFSITPHPAGWRSLEKITFAASAFLDVKVTAWWNGIYERGRDDGVMDFQLAGGIESDPHELATILKGLK